MKLLSLRYGLDPNLVLNMECCRKHTMYVQDHRRIELEINSVNEL